MEARADGPVRGRLATLAVRAGVVCIAAGGVLGITTLTEDRAPVPRSDAGQDPAAHAAPGAAEAGALRPARDTGRAGAPGTASTASTASTPSTAGSAGAPGAAGTAYGPDAGSGPARPVRAEPELSGAAPEPGAPVRILVLGDSVAYTLQASFHVAADELRARGIDAQITRMITQPGFGITADLAGTMVWDGAPADVRVPPARTFASWALQVGTAIAEDRPDLVVVLAGAWDSIPRLADGAWLAPGDPAWDAWFTARVARVNALLTAGGARAVWLEYPCIRSEIQTVRIEAVNAALVRAAEASPGRVTVLPFDDAVCPGGRFALDLPGPDGTAVRVRLDDGVHFELLSAPVVVSPWLGHQLAALVGEAA
jgi:hypothetical protein